MERDPQVAYLSMITAAYGKGTLDITMDAMNLIGLACAVLAALAFGVLLAHTLCQAFFMALRLHSRSLRSAPAAKPIEAQVQAS